jgi:hypothetical protein
MLMKDALHRFHTFKDVFLLGRAGKRANAKGNGRRTELVKKRKVDEEKTLNIGPRPRSGAK